jgi:hypothetical protein
MKMNFLKLKVSISTQSAIMAINTTKTRFKKSLTSPLPELSLNKTVSIKIAPRSLTKSQLTKINMQTAEPTTTI